MCQSRIQLRCSHKLVKWKTSLVCSSVSVERSVGLPKKAKKRKSRKRKQNSEKIYKKAERERSIYLSSFVQPQCTLQWSCLFFYLNILFTKVKGSKEEVTSFFFHFFLSTLVPYSECVTLLQNIDNFHQEWLNKDGWSFANFQGMILKTMTAKKFWNWSLCQCVDRQRECSAIETNNVPLLPFQVDLDTALQLNRWAIVSPLGRHGMESHHAL